MKNLAAFLTLSISLILSGCASTHINQESLRINKINIISYIATKNLNYTKHDSRTDPYTGGSYFGELLAEPGGIDDYINEKRAKSFAPILKILSKYDTNSVFKEKLASLKGDIFADKLNVYNSNKNNKSNRKLYELHLDGKFTLSENYLNVTTTITGNLNVNKINTLHKNVWLGTSNLDLGGLKVGKADVIQFWLDNPQELQNHIEKSMDTALENMIEYLSTAE